MAPTGTVPREESEHGGAGLEPVSTRERIVELDVVRGLALFGVLVAYALWSLGSPSSDTYGVVDRTLEQVLGFLVDTKAYTLFAFLFGVGFSIQMARADARSRSIVPTYVRRLLALIAIGLVHAVLLRNGDILVPYAVMGFVLLLFRNASNRTLVVCAIVGLFVPFAIRMAWKASGIPFPQRPDTEGMDNLTTNLLYVRYWYEIAIVQWPDALPKFLLGLLVGRARVFENIGLYRGVLRRLLVVGPIVGTAAYFARGLVQPPPAPWKLLAYDLLSTAHAFGLASFYLSALVLLLQSDAWRRRLAPLGAVGRMALTNYLGQSILLVPVCIAFGLFDHVTPTLGFGLALAVWVVQVPFSRWWLARYRFGPAEWVWRSLTYGQAQPMKIDATTAVPVVA